MQLAIDQVTPDASEFDLVDVILELDFEFNSVGATIVRELEERVVEFVRETLKQRFFVGSVCGCWIVNS
ncbi:hypothetical protein EUGRSUZ_E02154 [Eucalyptus grandis]|uniref:Uncharacterized protein n=2 Tax=Eucalyptus grandis TaxID=71139 RepID=A0ACC3KZC8_EUCGR|nr:hypothetical protein EUGRSUZ_E02154 [Eucalyptus grandis]